MKFKHFTVLVTLLISTSLSFSHGHDEADYHFTENIGQLDQKVKFHCKLHIGDVYFERNQFTFDLFSVDDLDRLYKIRHKKKLREL